MEQLYNIINNKYYIIRTGDFATNGNKKILYSLFALYYVLTIIILIIHMIVFQ